MVWSKRTVESISGYQRPLGIVASENILERSIILVLMLLAILAFSAQEEPVQIDEYEDYEQVEDDAIYEDDQYIEDDDPYGFLDENGEWQYEPPEAAVPRREKEVHEDVATYSEAAFVPTEISEEAWKAIIGEQDYDEIDPDVKPEEKDDHDEADQSVSPIWRWLLIGLIAGVFIYLIVRLTQEKTVANLKVRELDLATLDRAEEEIHGSDLDALLRQAIELKDFRSALRVRYLIVLRKLDAKGWIEHRLDKTSMSYIIELDGREQQSTFRELSRIFDYVWYAEVDVPAEDDRMFARRFTDYMTTIDG